MKKQRLRGSRWWCRSWEAARSVAAEPELPPPPSLPHTRARFSSRWFSPLGPALCVVDEVCVLHVYCPRAANRSVLHVHAGVHVHAGAARKQPTINASGFHVAWLQTFRTAASSLTTCPRGLRINPLNLHARAHLLHPVPGMKQCGCAVHLLRPLTTDLEVITKQVGEAPEPPHGSFQSTSHAAPPSLPQPHLCSVLLPRWTRISQRRPPQKPRVTSRGNHWVGISRPGAPTALGMSFTLGGGGLNFSTFPDQHLYCKKGAYRMLFTCVASPRLPKADSCASSSYPHGERFMRTWVVEAAIPRSPVTLPSRGWGAGQGFVKAP